MPRLSHFPPGTFQSLCHVSLLVGIFHLIYNVFNVCCSLYRIFMNAYQIRNIHIYSITNNMQHVISNRFAGEQLRLRTSYLQATTNNYGITYLLTYLFTYLLHGTESFSRNYPFSASQEIPHILWNHTLHYVFYKSPPSLPNLNQINPVYGPSRNILNIPLNAIVPSTPVSSMWFLSIRFPH